MFDSPKTLVELCMDNVCNNIEQLYIAEQKTDGHALLPRELAEILLTKLSFANKLNDMIMSLFSGKNFNLRNIILPNTKNLTINGLSILTDHKIKILQVGDLVGYLNYTVNELIGTLNEWTTQNLELLSLSNRSLLRGFHVFEFSDPVFLSKIKNLRSLDVSNTGFDTDNLICVVEALPHLDALDISNTKVDTFLPLEKKTNQLRKLCAFNLQEAIMDMKSFAQLKYSNTLTHIDLSFESYSNVFRHDPINWLQFLNGPDILPNLESLDISGCGSISQNIVQDFIINHTKLRFLGLMQMNNCGFGMFTVSTHPLYNPDLVVTGVATQEQLLNGLKFYANRQFFTAECLFHLNRLTKDWNSPKVEIIQLILNVMNCLSGSFLVQVRAVACLLNLTKKRLAPEIHPVILAKIIEAALDAMESFSNHMEIQRIAISIICSDHLLKDVKMDKFRCVRLVLAALDLFDDENMNCMGIAICSLVVPKMSETFQLRSVTKFMTILLTIAIKKVHTKTVDLTLKFTLSALWNLTDQFPSTRELFIEVGGIDICMKILNTFIGISSIEARVLSLINNITKVPYLRAMVLSNQNIIPTLRYLLRSERTQVRFLATTIIGHLALDWNRYSPDFRTRDLNELGHAANRGYH